MVDQRQQILDGAGIMKLSDACHTRFSLSNAGSQVISVSPKVEVSAAYSVEATIEATAGAIEQPSCRFSKNNPGRSRRTSLEIRTNTLSRIGKAVRSFCKESYLRYRLLQNCLSTVSVNEQRHCVEVLASLLHIDELKQTPRLLMDLSRREALARDEKAGADQNTKGDYHEERKRDCDSRP